MKNLIDVSVNTNPNKKIRKPNKIKLSMICVLAILLYGVFETAFAGDMLTTDTIPTGMVEQSRLNLAIPLPVQQPVDDIIPTVETAPLVVDSQPNVAQTSPEVPNSPPTTNIPSIQAPRISSGFGVRRHPLSGRLKHHNGIDLPFPRGTPILAPADGLVLFAGWRNGFGNVVQIDHGNGYQTLFAHNSVNLVHTGDAVTVTTTIARVGATGAATGPHIHFEVRFDGELVNPLRFIRN